MKFDWKRFSTGGKVIFISSCIAALSTFMKWVDIGFASETAWGQGTFLLFLFFVYPLWILLTDRNMNKAGGFVSSALAVVITIIYMFSKGGDMMGRYINFSGMGAGVFLAAAIALTVGVYMYPASTDASYTSSKSQSTGEFFQSIKQKTSGFTKEREDNDFQKTLEKLATLHNLGIITDEEFNAKKAEVLAKIK